MAVPIKSVKQNQTGGIRDVARIANVSIATVSRVFNKPGSVKGDTRNRVLEIARQLNYIPDNAARSLGAKKSWRVGALIPSMDDSIFARFIGSLQQHLSRESYSLLISIYDFDPETETKELRSLIEAGVDAIVFCGAQRSEECFEMLERRQIPFVNANIYDPNSDRPSVGPDYRSGEAEATRYLMDLGHTSIGLIDFSPDLNDRARHRLAGIRDALAERGLALPDHRYCERPFSIEDGRIGLRTLLEADPDITAIICGNDILAIGALFEARDQGISVPGEISLVGFDNLGIAAQVSPGLTTVNVPTTEMGARVAENLLFNIAGKSISKATKLATSLIIRGSSGPPKTG